MQPGLRDQAARKWQVSWLVAFRSPMIHQVFQTFPAGKSHEKADDS